MAWTRASFEHFSPKSQTFARGSLGTRWRPVSYARWIGNSGPSAYQTSSTRLQEARRVSDFARFKDDLNRTAVTAELLGEVMEMNAAIAPEERSFEARARRVIELLAEKGHDRNRGLLATAITIRLMALDTILQDREVQRWTIPGKEAGVTYVHSDLLRAAAEEAVLEGSMGEPMFDAANFRRRVLQTAATRGRA
jgi:hypothetical protein